MSNDTLLQHRVLDELRWDPSIHESEIDVTVKDGVAALSGRVDSYAQKIAAARAAERVSGIRVNVDALKVEVPRSAERPDTNIEHAAIQALAWDVEVPDEKIRVTVKDGWLTLEGEVNWQFQRVAAERVVRSLVGVTGVTNDIRIAPEVTAPDISQRIADALRRAADLDAKRIEVEARDGRVTLRGTVRTRAERRDAERAAWSAPGVIDVIDHITIGS